MGILDFLSTTVGIDPGSQNLRIIHDGRLAFDESTAISVDPDTNKVTGIGNETTHNNKNIALKPVNVAIEDFHAFEMFLRGACKKGLNDHSWFPKNYIMYFTIPLSTSQVAKRGYRDAAEHAGAKEVYLIEQSYASALGMGILFEKKDFMLVDYSASKIEVTVFENSIPVGVGWIPFGTWKLTRMIKNHIFREIQVLPSEEELFNLLSSYNHLKDNKIIHLQKKEIEVEELRKVMETYFKIIEDTLLETIEGVTRTSKIDKILANGLYFTGGGTLIKGIPERIALSGKLNYTLSADPLLDNINGLKIIMSDTKKYKDYIGV